MVFYFHLFLLLCSIRSYFSLYFNTIIYTLISPIHLIKPALGVSRTAGDIIIRQQPLNTADQEIIILQASSNWFSSRCAISHTETTLDYMVSYLAKNGKHRDIPNNKGWESKYSWDRPGPSTAPDWHFSGHVKTTQVEKTDRRYQSEAIEVRTNAQYSSIDHRFGFVEVHLLIHFAENVRNFGNIVLDGVDWSWGTLHKRCILDYY